MVYRIEFRPIKPGASDRSHTDTIEQKVLLPNRGLAPTMRAHTQNRKMSYDDVCVCVSECKGCTESFLRDICVCVCVDGMCVNEREGERRESE